MEPIARPSSVRIGNLSDIKRRVSKENDFVQDAKLNIFGDPSRSGSSQHFENILNGDLRGEWESLSKETNKLLFCDALLRMADRRVELGQSGISVRTYAWLAQHGEGESQAKAKQRLAALSGEGGLGLRAEGLLKGFAREASDPATLLAMAGGALVYRATRLAAMSRLAGSAGYFGSGFGLRFAGATAGLALEAPAFTLIGRASHGVGMTTPGLKEELLSSYLVLGGLKSVGSLSRMASGGIKNELIKQGLGNAGMYGGIMLGHGLETAFQLRDWRQGGVEWMEGMVTLFQFHVSGRMLGHLGGERYRNAEMELEFRTEQLAEFASIDPMRPANDGNYPSVEPAANGPHRAAEDIEIRMAVGAEYFLSESTGALEGPLRLLASAEGGDDGTTTRVSGGSWRAGADNKTGLRSPVETPRETRRLHFIVDEMPCEILPTGTQPTMEGSRYSAVISYLGGDAADPIPRMQFIFLDASGGPFGGKPLLIPRSSSDAKVFREGEIVVFMTAGVSSATGSTRIMRSGQGWAFIPDARGNLYHLKSFQIPSRGKGVLPVKYAHSIKFVSGDQESGVFRVEVANIRADEGSDSSLFLQIGRTHWKDLGFDWPSFPGPFVIPPRSIIAVEDSREVLEGYRKRLDAMSKIEPWKESDVIALGEMVIQIEDLAKMMSTELPWLEAFYERHGDRMILNDLPQAPSLKVAPSPWLQGFGDGAEIFLLRASRPDDFSLGVSGNLEAKKGLIMPPTNSDNTIYSNNNASRAQNLSDGQYRVRLQYHAEGRYQDIDINISPDVAKALGFTINNNRLFFPPNPISVDLQLRTPLTAARPWVQLRISGDESVKVQSDWKDRRHALLLEDGASYGALVPKMETVIGGKVFLSRVAGVFIFDLLFKDSLGCDRRVEVNLDDEEAIALGFQLRREGLLIPQGSYLLLKISQTEPL